MNASAKEKIFKSWVGINEVALIKEIATKGEHIDLCIEFWARKRKMAIKDYRLFFHDVVQNYVQRLLTERLVCKAENVLRNVQRDVRCCYYQFACECGDEELREIVLDHIRRKDGQDDMQDLHFNWELLQQLKEHPEIFAKCKSQMSERRIDLEAMLAMDMNFRKRLLVDLYFESRNMVLFAQLNKHSVWNYLVETQKCDELVLWCNAGSANATTLLEQQYALWLPLELEMYEFALKTLRDPPELLRDCFARAGHFFADERSNVVRLMRRICVASSFEVNRELLEKLPLARFLVERKQYMLLLRPFVSVRELEELVEEFLDQRKLIELIVTLRTYDLKDRVGFEKIFYATKVYLESCEEKRAEELAQIETVQEPLISFYEFLCYEPTLASLNCFLRSSALQRIPYLAALTERLETHTGQTGSSSTNRTAATLHKQLPTAYELLRKFKNIDFKHINRGSRNKIASFSNDRLCQRYARRYQLNFLHYLKQQRSAYAVYFLLTTQLKSYAQLARPQLFSACETVTELALQHADNAELIAHCVAFMEILGFDTQPLRMLLKLAKKTTSLACITNYSSVFAQVEAQLLLELSSVENNFPLEAYQALMGLVACSHSESQWPTIILEHYATRDDWWRLLLLAQYFDVPLNCLRDLISSFETRQIGDHLLRALSYDAPTLAAHDGASNGGSSKRQQSVHSLRHRKSNVEGMQAPTVTTSIETMTSSMSSSNDTAAGNTTNLCLKTLDHMQQLRFLASVDQSLSENQNSSTTKLDLFALLLLSASNVNEDVTACGAKFAEAMQNVPQQNSTSWNLAQNAVKYHLPVLAMLASTVNPNNSSWHWIVWLAVATDQWKDLLFFTANRGKDQRIDLAWHMIESTLRRGCVVTLYRSICIFYGPEYPFSHLCRFLCLTRNTGFCEEKAIHELSMYLLAWSNDEVCMPFEMGQTVIRREALLQRTMQVLLVHLQYNFDSVFEQQRFLACICRSGMTDLCGGQIDFCLLNEVFAILGSQPQTFTFNFECLLQQQRESQAVYKELQAAFLEAHAYDAAIRLANLLQLPICDIVYTKWIATLNSLTDGKDDDEVPEDFIDFAAYEAEVLEHALPPEVLVNFLLHAASLLTDVDESMTAARRKYILLQHALNVIKKHLLFPNECFDRDQIEYNMISCYLQLDKEAAANLSIYHSEYYEQIMLQERCVLYKSFLELKQLAGIEDLNSWSLKTPLNDKMQVRFERLLHRLLDESDIVEALRLQELFEYRPLDLRFIVFCMALAEGVTTIFSMSSEERQLLQDVEKSAFSKFNKRTLDSIRSSSMVQHGARGLVSGAGAGAGHSSSPMRDEFSDSSSTLEFEEIPSKEKRETLETIQGIASKLQHGIELGKRIFMAYRAAMYLDKEYLDVLRTKDANILLRSVAEESCLHRLLVVSDILNSTRKTEDEIADLLAYELTTAIIRPRFYIFTSGQKFKSSLKNADLWGYNIDRDLHLFLELTPNTTKLGNCLLKYCDALKSYRKYQDNLPYESTPTFEKLAEIIRIYGLPTTATAASASVAASSILSTSLTTAATITSTTIAGEGISPNVDGLANRNNAQPPQPAQVLSHKKQNLICVELLIKAHQCFVYECSMEGIANVLCRAKALNTILTHAKSWSLIVRMLIGIGRYREMYYCFDSLIKNEQFESLLGQFDEEKTIGLRQAILAYLREYAQENSRELLKLAALHFLMYKDLAETWEQDAQTILAKVLSLASVPSNISSAGGGGGGGGGGASFVGTKSEQTCIARLRFTPEVLSLLQQALQNYTHATENYLLDNKLILAQKCVSMCEVIAMQIDLLSKVANNVGGSSSLNAEVAGSAAGINQSSYQTSCVCVLSVQTRQEFRELVNAELSVPQALILSRGYGYDISWAEALLSQYILLMRKKYLQDFLALMPINDGIIENVIKGFQRYVRSNHRMLPQMEEHLSHLVTLVRSVTLKYKLASLLSMKALVMSLINDQTMHYLKDTDYARIENHNLPDV